jgi:SAM-dependent methyltransferase
LLWEFKQDSAINGLVVMKEQWDERYSINEYIYGIEPNRFFAENLVRLNPGKILLPGEGEGRNALFAAQNGWDVFAFDYSNVAKVKALKLIERNNFKIKYLVHDVNQIDYSENSFDAIAVFYLHLLEQERMVFHKKITRLLKPGGILLAEYFSKEQLKYDSGGPRKPELLYVKQEIVDDFKSYTSIKINAENIQLNEGVLHRGKASVIRVIGKK